MDRNETAGLWLFGGLIAGVILMLAFYGMPPMFGAPAPDDCATPDCLARLDLPAQLSMASAAWAMFATAAISTGLGAASLWLIWKNLVATRQLARDSSTSAQAAERAAEAATNANSVARDMSMAQTRAYLAITGVNASLDDDGTFKVTVLVANSGATPAVNLRLDIYLDLDEPHHPNQGFQLQVHGPVFAPSLPGGGTGKITAPFAFDDDELINLLQTARLRVQARGEVQYSDVYQRRHAEGFAFTTNDFAMFHFAAPPVELRRIPDTKPSPL